MAKRLVFPLSSSIASRSPSPEIPLPRRIAHAVGDAYGELFGRVLYPVYETHLRGRETLTALRELERSQWWSEAELADLNFRRTKAAFVYAERHVPFYRRRFAEHGVSAAKLQSPDDLLAFPVLTKKDLRDHAKDLVSEVFVGALHQSGTGGSTGEPARFHYDHRTYERRIAAALRADGWAGARIGDKEWHLWGMQLTGMTPRKLLKRKLFERALRRRMIDTFALSDGRVEALLDDYEAYRPAFVVGYTTPLYLFAKAAIERGRALPPPRGIVATAERLFPEQREVIERALGAPVLNRYGCREMMLLAAECERRDGMHLNLEGVHLELVRDGKHAAPGERGEVIVSDLHNRSMPMLRYVNQDVAIARSERCGCGRGLPALATIEGRVLDMLRGPDGALLPGEFFPHLLKDFPEVVKYQVHQAASLAITVRLVPGAGFSDDVARLVERKLRERLGKSADLRVDVVPEIPLTSGGKYRVTISEVPAELRGHFQPASEREPSSQAGSAAA